jgi:diamine N-acetyltransferase
VAVTIKEATPDDIYNLIDLGRETYKEHFENIWNNVDLFLDKDFSIDAVTSCINNRHMHRYLLAFDDNELVGFAKLNLNIISANEVIPGVELQKIYIKKHATGKAIGSALLNEATKFAVEHEYAYICLDVLKTNLKAQDFYIRNEFEIIGEMPFRTDKQEVGMFVMSKKLNMANKWLKSFASLNGPRIKAEPHN